MKLKDDVYGKHVPSFEEQSVMKEGRDLKNSYEKIWLLVFIGLKYNAMNYAGTLFCTSNMKLAYF